MIQVVFLDQFDFVRDQIALNLDGAAMAFALQALRPQGLNFSRWSEPNSTAGTASARVDLPASLGPITRFMPRRNSTV